MIQIRVMSFNIWRSGGSSIERTIEAIQATSADILGLQECDRATAAMIAKAARLDFTHDGTSNAILTKHRVATTFGRTADPWGGFGATIDLTGGGRVHVFDAHLHYTAYGPYSLREGLPANQILAQEEVTRMPGLRELLSFVKRSLASGDPTFLVGDFNAPSHLDYTDMAWPESMACHELGLADSYRVVHPEGRTYPDAFGHDEPGITWTPLLAEETRGVFDRIDFVYYATDRATKPLASSAIDQSATPWPSDHRAVLSVFEVGQ